MADDEAALVEFVQGVDDWDKYADDAEVMDILTKIKSRVEELDEGDDEEDQDRRAKVVVVGDGAVGKTCLFITYAKGKFPEEYVPTVFENYTHDTTYKGEPFLLHMWDTAGQEDYDRLRPLSYPGTDVVVLCFSLVNEETFESIRKRWNPEVNHYLDGIPKVLVGTKLDMREEKVKDGALTQYEEITTAEGEALAKEIGAAAYVETSPLTRQNLETVFEEVIAAALANRDEPETKKSKSSKSKSSSSKKKKKKEGEDGEKKKKKRSKKEGEDGEKKKRKKSSKRAGETDEERRERRRKRKEEKEAGGKPKKRRKKTVGEGDEKAEKKRKRKKEKV